MESQWKLKDSQNLKVVGDNLWKNAPKVMVDTYKIF